MLGGKVGRSGLSHPIPHHAHKIRRGRAPFTACAVKTSHEPEAVLNVALPSHHLTLSPHNEVHLLAAASEVQQAAASPLAAVSPGAWTAAAVAGLALAGLAIKRDLDTPRRTYNDSSTVGKEYDSWTEEGILEHYWGDHIHLGYYSDAERAAGYKKKDFKKAKLDFVDEMLTFSGTPSPEKILDVGCGFGGTSRHLAYLYPKAQVEGITLSPKQVVRGTELAVERKLNNVTFKVMDALNMDYPDNSFDLVWACESGEHMPDKKKYVEEMTRVLKPGGTLVIACWCQRDETTDKPFSEADRSALQFLYEEWAHPYFISIEEFVRLMKGTGQLDDIRSDDWTPQTIPSWRHSVWVGVWSPWYVISRFNLKTWYRTLRDIVTLERMHRAFDRGLMQYGMMRAVKKTAAPAAAAAKK